jgi:hypothetical protein
VTDLCACGCGDPVAADSRGRPRRYAARGHNLRSIDNYMKRPDAPNPFAGRQHTAATRERMSVVASVPKPWLRGDRNGMFGRTGTENPNWRGGGAPERQRLYATAEGRAFLQSVYARDGFRCVRCGEPKRGPRSLHVHHLRGWAECPEGRLDPDNAITLCRTCHVGEHTKGGDADE